jgi:hypothetical protein
MDILDTRQRKKEVYHFIIIVPHRDSLKLLEDYRAKLFAAGFPGAWSFPTAAPLASVSRPFSGDELKGLGRNIRLLPTGNDGKILCEGNACVKFTTEKTKPRSYTEEERRRPLTGALRHGDRKDISFFGSELSLHIEESLFNQTARAKILNIYSPPVLCAALLASKESPPSEEGPVISFRAASLANMVMRPLESGVSGYSFEWKIGPLVWLPKHV